MRSVATFSRAAGTAGRSLLAPVPAAILGLAVVVFAPGIPLAGGREASVARSPQSVVQAVEAIGITVADLDRSVGFFSRVLDFEKVSDREIAGGDYERLEGVFGLRMRVVRMRLGDEAIDLTEYLVPKGRQVPVDSRSNDRWFQHIAIIVSDMDRAYAQLRQFGVEHASSGPQRLPDWNPSAGGIRAFYFKDPDGHPLEILAPADGRPAPGDAQANDLASWQTRLVVKDVSVEETPLRAAGGRLVSPGRIGLEGGELGFRAGLQARDPDGHALLLIELPEPRN